MKAALSNRTPTAQVFYLLVSPSLTSFRSVGQLEMLVVNNTETLYRCCGCEASLATMDTALTADTAAPVVVADRTPSATLDVVVSAAAANSDGSPVSALDAA
ncbi:hypothetical protein F441_03871 [Phytophthora nicotianae CJ01A1]|uniref:Uncharacterized protein n=2 Tax=Phytophthora nicotianae TaxID=4792 RepID=W2XKH8_PHYNI|nr:hypothetical protein L915_03774 [Phytophthora nicotianae]ETP22923.1 hypothetical protein F441_03871 [Phytophthora nicotianae CJ01A1]